MDPKYIRPIKTAEEAHARAMEHGADCRNCSLYAKRAGPVMGDLVPDAIMTVVGEAPGVNEVHDGRPFVGKSGQELDLALKDGGLRRRDVSVLNVIACQPPKEIQAYLTGLKRQHDRACRQALKDKKPLPPAPKSPIECCKPRLEYDLKVSNSRTLLAVGGTALEALSKHVGIPYAATSDAEGKIKSAIISEQHGAPIQLADGRVLCSSLHPAFAMREPAYKSVVRNDIARAARIAQRGIQWKRPDPILFPCIEKIEEVCRSFIERSEPVFADVETGPKAGAPADDGLSPKRCVVRCIGLGQGDVIIVIPLYWMNGQPYWEPELETRAKAAVKSVLDHCDLVFHNGQFDTAVCQHFGLMSRETDLRPSRMKRWNDSMIGHHDTDFNDLPHKLGFVARQASEGPLWKSAVDHKDSSGVQKDPDLHLYNSFDIFFTKRCWEFVAERIAKCGTQQQYEVDRALAPIAREMTDLGIPVDERRRGVLSVKFGALTTDFQRRFQEAAGRPINPRSWQQVGEWLFDDLGYEPSLNPKGYQWKDDDDWSTSTPALMQLQDRGVDEGTNLAIDALLRFRACEAIRGRYIDRLEVEYVDDPILALEGRAEKVGDTFPERPALSVIHPNWNIHVVPSGRWSSQPSCQNWPAGAWAIDGKPTNLRKMVVPPPGHVFIGADFDQVELRIYAAVANDRFVLQALREGLDPHSYNAATLLAPTEAQVLEVYNSLIAMKKGSEGEKAKLKYVRTVAKRFAFL